MDQKSESASSNIFSLERVRIVQLLLLRFLELMIEAALGKPICIDPRSSGGSRWVAVQLLLLHVCTEMHRARAIKLPDSLARSF